MAELSKFRKLFHNLPNCINGIHVISFTYSEKLKKLDYDKITKTDVQNEISIKLGDIDMYHKRFIDSFASVCKMMERLNLPVDCKTIINEINRKTEDIYILIKNAEITSNKIGDTNFKEDTLQLAKILQEFTPESQVLGDLVQRLKQRLVDLGKYYSVSDVDD